ncbi:sugar isomerase [Saccharopolyspora hirsuta]|uniref:Sugar isomerase n=1 Tax=Saccharopolyspora hirsuta TaxID=1837 RepID=A0A5M7BF11_SACHI|nr:sugar isomerase [Saccharopolyspora hirsuta]KAA5826081.1 sugar isomerase [Saccharopolyspora hirsuta]
MAQSSTLSEITSQPGCWRRAAELAETVRDVLPRPGERVAAIGCGTSWFMAQSYAALREQAGLGITDAFAASEMPRSRRYDRIVALTRSGTTTEVHQLLAAVRGTSPTVVLTATPAEVRGAADEVVDLSFCDERSVVQTRFATSTLALLRTHLGHRITEAADQAEAVLSAQLPAELLEAQQFTFLGTGWSAGIAHEAALKLREAAGVWTESYPALEYRHGPVSIAEPGRATWLFGGEPPGLAEEIRRTGAAFVHHAADPMAELVRAQLLAVGLAERRGIDPDRPRNLSRSVVLP